MIEIYTQTSEKLQIPQKVVEHVINHYCKAVRAKFATPEYIRIKIPYIVVFKLKRLKLMVYIRQRIKIAKENGTQANIDKVKMLLSIYKQLLTSNYKISKKWFKFNRKMTKQSRKKENRLKIKQSLEI
jgi:hypothetical protein